MIASFCDYISKYIHGRGKKTLPMPGEHHFVSTYLVPKLFAMTGEIPDYVNPDGTKAILGDIVYYRDGKHHFGIEVKLGTIRLTKKEFNEWIVGQNELLWPNVYIGIASNGISLASWTTFRDAYFQSVRSKKGDWSAVEIEKGYGPTIQVNSLVKVLPATAHFQWSSDGKDEDALEERFTLSLAEHIVALKRLTATR